MQAPERPPGSDRLFHTFEAQNRPPRGGETAPDLPAQNTASPPEAVPLPDHETPALRAPLPRWHVILREQPWYELSEVVDTIMDLTPLGESIAVQRMFESHYTGSSFLLSTHRERAELYQAQFAARRLVVRIEPAQ